MTIEFQPIPAKSLSPRVFIACVSHIPPWARFPPEVCIVDLGDSRPAGGLSIAEWAPDFIEHHPELAGFCGCIVVRRYLETQDFSHVCMLQYRKFVSPRVMGVESAAYPAMQVYPDDRTAPFSISAEHLGLDLFREDSSPVDAIIGSMASFPGNCSYVRHYARCHYTEDFLDLASACVASGALSAHQAGEMLIERRFFPGGLELGIFPIEFWISSVRKIESAVLAMISEGKKVRTDYQKRYLAFAVERMSSYLLAGLVYNSAASVLQGRITLLTQHAGEDYVPNLGG